MKTNRIKGRTNGFKYPQDFEFGFNDGNEDYSNTFSENKAIIEVTDCQL